MELNHLQTPLTWEDLDIHPKTRQQIRKLIPSLSTEKKGSYLFYGASGTGKTLAAALLGKEATLSVHYTDLSLLISKYIGETEKNIDQLFTKASQKGWVLFFDEADALFGKRTSVKDAHDRYANQEVSYLLRHIESYDGIVFLSTPLKAKAAKHFTPYFDVCIKFRRNKK